MNQVADATAAAAAPARTIFGQPRGLATLFLTEMWERFTYYGMRGVLILFMVAAVSHGGLGLDDKTASAIYGMYIGGTYLFGLLGGWIADRLIGAQRAVVAGGVLIAGGNLMLALGSTDVFFLGLLVITIGVGLLKPNASAMVAALYPEGGSRRDAGFSVFYMGINLGALIGPLIVGWFADRYGWRWGFAVPALGMAVGLAQFVWTRHYLGNAGVAAAGEQPGAWKVVVAIAAAVALAAALVMAGVLKIDAVAMAAGASWAMLVLGVGYFVYLLFFAGLTAVERQRVLVMVALVAASVTFWAGYEQTGASMNLFADRYTDRHVFGWEMPAAWLQAVNPLFIIAFAPVFAALWIALGRRGRDLNAAAKFGAGLILLGLGFIAMYFASLRVLGGAQVLPAWLILAYLLHTFGELSLSPVGLSYMTKLAPPRFVGQVMGMWFLSMALGSNLAGQLSGQYDAGHLESLPGLFLKIFWYGAIGGLVMLILTPFARRMMAGVR
ncbi:MAG: peptide MFS transporter [Gammaproteobacteria bacterium]|nr:MAG: peptide MFS transporter [Gammaproteobacteria bacterium]